MSWEVIKAESYLRKEWAEHMHGEAKKQVLESVAKDLLKTVIDRMTLEQVAGVAPFMLYELEGDEYQARLEICVRVNENGVILAEQYREKAKKIFK